MTQDFLRLTDKNDTETALTGLAITQVSLKCSHLPNRRFCGVSAPSRWGRENQHYMVEVAAIGIIRRLRRGDAATIKAVAL